MLADFEGLAKGIFPSSISEGDSLPRQDCLATVMKSYEDDGLKEMGTVCQIVDHLALPG